MQLLKYLHTVAIHYTVIININPRGIVALVFKDIKHKNVHTTSDLSYGIIYWKAHTSLRTVSYFNLLSTLYSVH